MELMRMTMALGLVAFLGALGYNVGDKIDSRGIDYLITVGGIVLCLIVVVGGAVIYAMGKARVAARNMEEFGVSGFGDGAPMQRRLARSAGRGVGYLEDRGGQGWGAMSFNGPPQLTPNQETQGSFSMDAPYGGWGQQ